jgi:hypothetical protein
MPEQVPTCLISVQAQLAIASVIVTLTTATASCYSPYVRTYAYNPIAFTVMLVTKTADTARVQAWLASHSEVRLYCIKGVLVEVQKIAATSSI